MSYEKQAWVTGDVVTAQKLNHIEDGIDSKYEKPSSGIPSSDLASIVQTSLGKADTAVQPETGKGLFSGSYNDLSNKPTIPTKVSELTNDSGYLTTHQSLSGYATETYVDDKIDDIVIPTKVSDLENDEGYLTSHQSLSGYATESYVTQQINAIPTPDVSGQISTHNSSNAAHNDIRTLISTLTTRLDALADSDDTTLDQLSEIVAYIKNNKSLIDGITTGKVSVSDIVNNLTTSASNKPLSAAQGVALKALIDAITVPTKTSELTNDSGYLTSHQSLSGYATESWVTSKNYLTSHQDISGKQDTISDLSTIRIGATAGATAYQKPTSGIPKTDLSSTVQTSLGKADSALQEHQSLSAYRTSAAQDTIDATKQNKIWQTATEPADAQIGDYWDDPNDTMVAVEVDSTPTSGSTNAVSSGGVYTALGNKESSGNKVTTLSSSSTDTQYPSAKCVYDLIGNIETLLGGLL